MNQEAFGWAVCEQELTLLVSFSVGVSYVVVMNYTNGSGGSGCPVAS